MTVKEVIRWLTETVPYECKSAREAEWSRFLGRLLDRKLRDDIEVSMTTAIRPWQLPKSVSSKADFENISMFTNGRLHLDRCPDCGSDMILYWRRVEFERNGIMECLECGTVYDEEGEK